MAAAGFLAVLAEAVLALALGLALGFGLAAAVAGGAAAPGFVPAASLGAFSLGLASADAGLSVGEAPAGAGVVLG